MPYVPLSRISGHNLANSAERRWKGLLEARPDLEPAVDLQRRLLTLVIDLAGTLEKGGMPRLSLPARYLAAKLARGVPALSGEPVPLPVPTMTPTLIDLCAALAGGGAGEAAEHIREVLATGQIEPGSLLKASLDRDQDSIRTGGVHRGLSPDLLWLVSELAVSPFAHLLQRQLFGKPGDEALRSGARGVEPRLLSGVRLVAGAGRGGRRAPHAALLVLLERLGDDHVRVHLLRGKRREVRHGRTERRAQGPPPRGLLRLRRLSQDRSTCRNSRPSRCSRFPTSNPPTSMSPPWSTDTRGRP